MAEDTKDTETQETDSLQARIAELEGTKFYSFTSSIITSLHLNPKYTSSNAAL